MTCSDLFKGFYQQKISRKSRRITSFTNPYTGVSYSWRVLTMSLMSSPSAFIQMMGAVFKNKQKYNFLFLHMLTIYCWQVVLLLNTWIICELHYIFCN